MRPYTNWFYDFMQSYLSPTLVLHPVNDQSGAQPCAPTGISDFDWITCRTEHSAGGDSEEDAITLRYRSGIKMDAGRRPLVGFRETIRGGGEPERSSARPNVT